MAKLVRFVDSETEQILFINPALVRVVRPGTDGGTVVEFDAQHSILIDGQAEAAVKALDNA